MMNTAETHSHAECRRRRNVMITDRTNERANGRISAIQAIRHGMNLPEMNHHTSRARGSTLLVRCWVLARTRMCECVYYDFFLLLTISPSPHHITISSYHGLSCDQTKRLTFSFSMELLFRLFISLLTSVLASTMYDIHIHTLTLNIFLFSCSLLTRFKWNKKKKTKSNTKKREEKKIVKQQYRPPLFTHSHRIIPFCQL